MWLRVGPIWLIATSIFLSGCANFDYVHDPETGFINKSQIGPFLKSIRCELKTFYAANDARQQNYTLQMGKYSKKLSEAAAYKKEGKYAEASSTLTDARQIRADAVHAYPHFTLSSALFGGVYLDLKVIDAFGLPTAGASSSTFNNKTTFDAARSATWLFGPTLNNQNTYEQIDSFLIEQKPNLYAGPDPFGCYAGLSADLDGVAAGRYPELAAFTRIRVNGTVPLAAWLQERSEQLWSTFRADTERAEVEQIIPVQSTYNFTIQITGGIDVKYSLVSPIWSPAQIDLGASSIHSSLMTISVNGVDASLAAGAKTGIAVNLPVSRDATPTGTPGYIDPGHLKDLKLDLTPEQKSKLDDLNKPDTVENFAAKLNLSSSQKSIVQKAVKPIAPSKRAILQNSFPASRGYLLYPLPLSNPSQ